MSTHPQTPDSAPLTAEAEAAQQRLVRAVEDAAGALPPERLKDALSQGLEHTHLHVEDNEQESVLIDENGKAKRGPVLGMTREEMIDAGRGGSLLLSKSARKRILLGRVLRSEGLAGNIETDKDQQ